MSLWADAKIREFEARIKELETLVANMTPRPFGAMEPTDKRTKEWKDWHEKHG